jgi:hypothetical protein
MSETTFVARICGRCLADNDEDALFCDQCASAFPPPETSAARAARRFGRMLGFAGVVALVYLATYWSPAILVGVLDWREARRGEAPLWAEAAEGPEYALVLGDPARYDGKLVDWILVTAGPGRALHRGDPAEPVRLVGDNYLSRTGNSGRSSTSYRVLGRLTADGKPGVALTVVSLR